MRHLRHVKKSFPLLITLCLTFGIVSPGFTQANKEYAVSGERLALIQQRGYGRAQQGHGGAQRGYGGALQAQEQEGLRRQRRDSIQQQEGPVQQRGGSIQQAHRDSSQHSERFLREEPRNEVKLKLAENRLIIENLTEDGILEIYNIMGAKVFSRRIKEGTTEHILSLPKGYYIIKIGKFTRKISIK